MAASSSHLAAGTRDTAGFRGQGQVRYQRLSGGLLGLLTRSTA